MSFSHPVPGELYFFHYGMMGTVGAYFALSLPYSYGIALGQRCAEQAAGVSLAAVLLAAYTERLGLASATALVATAPLSLCAMSMRKARAKMLSLGVRSRTAVFGPVGSLAYVRALPRELLPSVAAGAATTSFGRSRALAASLTSGSEEEGP